MSVNTSGRRDMLIVRNPAARRAPDERDLWRAAAPLREAGWRVELRETDAPGDATRIAAAAARESVDIVVACGGDGTVHEVVNGLAGSETALAVAPAGTADVWAREAFIPRDPRRALAMLPHARRARVDLGVVNGRHFLLMCGIGLDAETVRRVAGRPRAKRWLGRAAYAAAGVSAALTMPPEPAEVTVDGQRVRRNLLFALAGNTRLYGGVARITGAALIDDGALDLCVFHDGGESLTPLRRARLAVRGLRGDLRRRAGSGIDYLRGARIEVTTRRPLPVQADGELIGETPVSLAVVPAALTVLIAPRPNPLLREGGDGDPARGDPARGASGPAG